MKTPVIITEINIIPTKPSEGLLGFCSFVIDSKYYVGSVGIFSKRDGTGIRLVYPKKHTIDCFHPITREVGEAITQAVESKFTLIFKARF